MDNVSDSEREVLNLHFTNVERGLKARRNSHAWNAAADSMQRLRQMFDIYHLEGEKALTFQEMINHPKVTGMIQKGKER